MKEKIDEEMLKNLDFIMNLPALEDEDNWALAEKFSEAEEIDKLQELKETSRGSNVEADVEEKEGP